MSGTIVLLHLAGAVALLLWATRMVRTGVERAYGDVLRHRLRGTLGNPVLAALTGAALAIALQSSTAVTLLVGSFAGSGIVTGIAGLLAVRGAEVGSALVVKVLSYNLTVLVPVALLLGTIMFMATERREFRQAGRILVGVGLLILSLEMMGQASEPLRDSRILPVMIGYLSADPVSAFLIAAALTYLFHSSIAAILFLLTLADRGVIGNDLALVMVLGVNLGSSIIAPLLTRHSPPAARIVPMGNLLMRGAGSVLVLAAIIFFEPSFRFLGDYPASRIVDAHIVFNVAVLIVGIPLARPVEWAASRLVALNTSPAAASTLAPKEASALDDKVLSVPSLALANVTREVVRICETVEIMLRDIIDLFEAPSSERIAGMTALDDTIDRRHAAIKLYLARIQSSGMTERELGRTKELLDACIKLEQVGDIVVRNLLVHVRKKLDRKLTFTEEGWLELAAFHKAVLANARLAFNVLISRDRETARLLVIEKDRLREMERETSGKHFARLRDGTARSVETSSIHLDTIRDLKQINALLAGLAYPVLEEQGLLRDTRLRPAQA